MKSICKFFSFILIVFSIYSCEKEGIDPNLPNNDSTRTVYSEDLSLHNPMSIALVKTNNSFKKRGIHEEEDFIYTLYEKSKDSFNLVTGTAGNQIYFTGSELELFRLNKKWQFLASTTGGGGAGRTNIVMTIESLEIDGNSDTIITRNESTLGILLINIETGNLYDIIDVEPDFEYGYTWRNIELFYYNDSLKDFYFKTRYGLIGKVNLADLSFEKIDLLQDISTLGWHCEIWGVLDGYFIFADNSITEDVPSVFSYKPNQGIIVKSNIDNSMNVVFNSCFEGKDNLYFEGSGDSLGFMLNPQNEIIWRLATPIIRNDSLVFLFKDFVLDIFNDVDTKSVELPQIIDGTSVFRPIYYNNQKWRFSQNNIWCIEEDIKHVKVIELEDKVEIHRECTKVSDRYIFSSNFSNELYKVDLEEKSVTLFLKLEDINLSSFNLGSNSNIFIKGLRYSDLQNIVFEYDCESGEKLGEWLEEDAPTESNIVFLSPIVF